MVAVALNLHNTTELREEEREIGGGIRVRKRNGTKNNKKILKKKRVKKNYCLC